MPKKCISFGRRFVAAFCHTRRKETSRAKVTVKPLARLWSEDGGVAALEYVFVFPLLLAVMIGTFQFGLMFTRQSLMDNAARDAARLIRIGTLTGASGAYSSNLVTAVCNDLTVSGYSLVPSCTATIQIYVAAGSSGTPAGVGFTTLTVANVNNGVMTQTKASLSPKYDVILQVGYNMPWVASFLSGNAMLMSTLAFQTEPY
ncbi:TadE/TadG family type IV pilus assembly protein [Burkholderia sp. S171]|uniref:TadE/TadG family type IV pilus assembly protein n=1 Tax=Burkholderia sp. S171 TaxID=1641860 RepID=UPI00131DC210|nr:TadE/TadG family type IV pilus assembly protein [Burkholderia sp. S171]